MKPTDILFAWKKESAIDRIHGCKVMLHLHGFLTESEALRVRNRIRKWEEKFKKDDAND